MAAANPPRPLAPLLAMALAGCVYGSIEPGDPVDHALICAVPLTQSATAIPAPGAPSGNGELVFGPEAGGGARGGYYTVTPREPTGPAFATGTPRTVFLNREGGKVTAGYDDAARNVSSVLQGTGRSSATLPRAAFSDADWLKVVACVADEFSRFNLQIVAERPTEPGFMMAMIGGTPAAIGLPQGVGGVAPLDKNGCRVIEGAIVYVFSEALPGGGPTISCEVAAQEIAHAFSLDHELLASDPMTYLNYNGHKVFQDQEAQCGESRPRACVCGRPGQNSVKVLADKAGLFQDPNGPAVSLVSPSDGAVVPPGALSITVRATHPTGVQRVTLHYRDASSFVVANCGGGAVPCNRAGDDFVFKLPSARGLATFWAEAANPAGETNLTHPRTISAGSAEELMTGPLRIAVSVDLAAFAAERLVKVSATITSTAGPVTAATLVWTDARGAISENPMCSGKVDTWSRTMKVAPRGGARGFVVQASDGQGNSAVSPRFSIAADF